MHRERYQEEQQEEEEKEEEEGGANGGGRNGGGFSRYYVTQTHNSSCTAFILTFTLTNICLILILPITLI